MEVGVAGHIGVVLTMTLLLIQPSCQLTEDLCLIGDDVGKVSWQWGGGGGALSLQALVRVLTI